MNNTHDTSLKAAEYFRSLGLQYLFRNVAYVAAPATAMFVENRRIPRLIVRSAASASGVITRKRTPVPK
jgi:hypothetical protein